MKKEEIDVTGQRAEQLQIDIDYVENLAKLALTPEEKEQAREDMAEMLDYIQQLDELDTEGIEPMNHIFPLRNVFREDMVTNGDGSAEALLNAPESADGGFIVPKTIEGQRG